MNCGSVGGREVRSRVKDSSVPRGKVCIERAAPAHRHESDLCPRKLLFDRLAPRRHLGGICLAVGICGQHIRPCVVVLLVSQLDVRDVYASSGQSAQAIQRCLEGQRELIEADDGAHGVRRGAVICPLRWGRLSHRRPRVRFARLLHETAHRVARRVVPVVAGGPARVAAREGSEIRYGAGERGVVQGLRGPTACVCVYVCVCVCVWCVRCLRILTRDSADLVVGARVWVQRAHGRMDARIPARLAHSLGQVTECSEEVTSILSRDFAQHVHQR